MNKELHGKSGLSARILVFGCGLVAASACGGTTPGDGAASGGAATDAPSATGGLAATGGASGDTGGSSTGGGSTGGNATGGSSSGGVGSESGGASSGGAGGSAGSGGTGDGGSLGTGGVPAICGCDAATVLVCGVDGQTYDAGCGDICVPVEIACQGECPCEEGCGCELDVGSSCGEDGEQTWTCFGSEWNGPAILEAGCTDTGMSAIRYCCPASMTPDDFCAP